MGNDLTILHAVTQAGSFGMLVLIAIYVGRVVVPLIFNEHRRIVDKFDAALQRNEDRHAAELARRDERDTMLIASINRLADRVERLEAASKTHSPLHDSS